MRGFGTRAGTAFLSFCLLFTALTACGGESGTKQGSASPGADTQMSSLAPYETDPNVVVWGLYSPEGEAWQEPLNQLLRSQAAPYTVRIVNYFSPEDEFGSKSAEEVADLLARRRDSGEQMDVISLPPKNNHDAISGTSSYVAVAGRGLLLPLDDLLTSARGRELVQSVPARDRARSQIDGVTYGVSVHRRSVMAAVYDKAYLESRGIAAAELSADLFANEAVFQQIRDAEPDASFAPYRYNEDAADSLGLWRVTESMVYTPEGRFDNLFETPALRARLALLYDWKAKGLLSAFGGRVQKFAATTALAQTDAVFEGSYAYSGSAGKEVAVDAVYIPDTGQAQVAPYWGDSQNGVAAWSANQTYAFDFLARLYTDRDIANLILYGVEGQDYTLADGVAAYREGAAWQWIRENFVNSLLAYPQAAAARDARDYQERYDARYETYIPDGFRFDPAPVAEELAAVRLVYYPDPNTLWQPSKQIQALTFSLASVSWEADMEDVSRQLKEAGIDAVIAEAERQLAAWRQKHGA